MHLSQMHSKQRICCCVFLPVIAFLIGISESSGVFAQTSEYRGRIGQIGCRPVKERASETGCWILASAALGKLSTTSIYWHLHSYPSRAAADAAKGPRSTVVEALGEVWLFSIEG